MIRNTYHLLTWKADFGDNHDHHGGRLTVLMHEAARRGTVHDRHRAVRVCANEGYRPSQQAICSATRDSYPGT
ncbi:hypothetical protein BUPH_08441 (plasmid) [Paraburkholderia phenoliruptrix BR3459a]|uniref:Uncharacterized protein n=1 Tax=Paraburkholderia phenoliruptrix BR3459a TaxID=1229205 RepID=K0E0J7_9BURK|nr:hypothetical protein BUPH_08441 [Paraburkholderia phenoliruptrix BR3459a]